MALVILFIFDYFLSEILSPDDVLAPTRLAQATLYEHWKGYAPLDHAYSFPLTALFAKIMRTVVLLLPCVLQCAFPRTSSGTEKSFTTVSGPY